MNTTEAQSRNNLTNIDIVDNISNETSNQVQSSSIPYTPIVTNVNDHQTPNEKRDNRRSMSDVSTVQVISSNLHVSGEVVLTPTHNAFTPQPVNPHSSLRAITPMTSGTSQAKNSIKIMYV